MTTRLRGLGLGVLLVLLAMLAGACASTGFLMAKPQVTLYREAYPAKPEDAAVKVYRTSLPDQEYEEIGEIQCGDTDDDWNLRQILIKAREIGADGVIIVGRSGVAATAIPVGGVAYGISQEYGLTAVAIRYVSQGRRNLRIPGGVS